MKQTLHSFFLFLILFIGHVNYVKADTTIASGTLSGKSINWALTSADGTQEKLKLSITGTGDMPDYYSSSNWPWDDFRQVITSISIGEDITRIGRYAFYNVGVDYVDIPSSQIGFIRAFIITTYDCLVSMFPSLKYTLDYANKNLKEWQKLLDQHRAKGWTPKKEKKGEKK